MICKNCIHFDVCQFFLDEETQKTVFDCYRFKPKSRFIELPCEVGQTVYKIARYCNTDPRETTKEQVQPWDCENYCGRSDCSFSEYRIEKFNVGNIDYIFRIRKEIGKTVFLTKEEAEKALAERNKK